MFRRLLVLCCMCAALLLQPFPVASEVVDTEDDVYWDSDEGAEGHATLIVHKHVLGNKVVQGRNLTIVLTAHNVGTGTAENVKLQDTLPDATFELLEGSLSASVRSIDGGRKYETQYVVVPKQGGKGFAAPPAAVTYSSPGKGKVQSQSTAAYIYVLSTGQNIERFLVEVGKYASFGVLKTSRDWMGSGLLISIVVVLGGGYAIFATVTQTRAESRRKAAVRDLGISD